MVEKGNLNLLCSSNPIPVGARAVAQVEITSEEETASGWQFSAQILHNNGDLQRCTLHLSWADYNLWSPNGADAPEKVAEAALRFLISRQPATELKQSFDASLLRRIAPDADESVSRWISR
jgi:hypothetical protein